MFSGKERGNFLKPHSSPGGVTQQIKVFYREASQVVHTPTLYILFLAEKVTLSYTVPPIENDSPFTHIQ